MEVSCISILSVPLEKSIAYRHLWLIGGKITEYGIEFGIEAETRFSSKGNGYEVFYYTEETQRGIVVIWQMERRIRMRQLHL